MPRACSLSSPRASLLTRERPWSGPLASGTLPRITITCATSVGKSGDLALTNEDYPSRLLFKLVDEAKVAAKKRLVGVETEGQFAKEIAALAQRYEDPTAVDKLASANAKVEEVRVQLEENMNMLVKNQGDIEVNIE